VLRFNSPVLLCTEMGSGGRCLDHGVDLSQWINAFLSGVMSCSLVTGLVTTRAGCNKATLPSLLHLLVCPPLFPELEIPQDSCVQQLDRALPSL
jgi:hypothetical protein